MIPTKSLKSSTPKIRIPNVKSTPVKPSPKTKKPTILEGIAKVESIDGTDTPTELKTTELFKEEPKQVTSESSVIEKQIKKLQDSTKSNLVRQYNEWVNTDKVRKLRLANVVYAHNFSLPGTEINYTQNTFNNIVAKLLSENKIIIFSHNAQKFKFFTDVSSELLT